MDYTVKFKQYMNQKSDLWNVKIECENEIERFIKDEWNNNLECYVDIKGHYIDIEVFDEVDPIFFEQFIINELCKLFKLDLEYAKHTVHHYVNPVEKSYSWHLKILD